MWLARLRHPHAGEPQVCPSCGRDFVCPVEWGEASATHIWVRLRCGECGEFREAEFTDEVLELYDRRLDEAAASIARAAEKLHRDWRLREADAFAAALDRDLIDAGDFGR